MKASQSVESGSSQFASQRKTRTGWQIHLRTLLLLIAAIAAWTTYLSNRRQIALLQGRVTAMQPLVRELVVDDQSKIAIVKLEEHWFDENIWDIYLPEGKYQLCLATREIDDKGIPQATKCEPIASGRHRLELEQIREGDLWRVNATWNKRVLLSVEEGKEWDPGSGSTGGSQVSESQQFTANQPVVLFRRRFSRRDAKGQMSTPSGPTEGVQVWIEPVR